MNGIVELGAVTLRGNQRALEVLANNIANMNTPGFKRTDVVYSEVSGDAPATPTNAASLATAGEAVAGGLRVSQRQMISAQGELRSSTNALDIAIDGRGFIPLMGPEGRLLLSRGGRLEIDGDGYLAVAGAAALQAMIAVPDDATGLSIARSGIVSAKGGDGQAIELGRIDLVRVDNDADLTRVGAGLFTPAEDARVQDFAPGEDGAGAIVQNMIEGSNVDFSAAMVEMLMIQRAYAASAQIVQAGDQLASISNNLKR